MVHITPSATLPSSVGTTAPEGLLISHIQAHIRKGDAAKERATQNIKKSEDHYIAAGQYLTMLKASYAPTWQQWENILKVKLKLSTGRASELMQLADGRKNLQEIRADTAKRVAKHAKASSSLVSKTNEENCNHSGLETPEESEIKKAEDRLSTAKMQSIILDRVCMLIAEMTPHTLSKFRDYWEENCNDHPATATKQTEDGARYSFATMKALAFTGNTVQATAKILIGALIDEAVRERVIKLVLEGELQSSFADFRDAIADLYQKISRAGK